MESFIKTHRNTILLALLLTIIAAIPRLYNLGEPGFYMDEETTAFAARSYYETGKPTMPSGMPYYRALPHTWLISQTIKIFGPDNELSYRLPGAIFGILTIPLLFLLARRYTGTHVAFLAALLLALSEWHIITSRQARMYAPMLFFYVACVFAILRWSQEDNWRNLLVASLTFIATVSFHRIGVFAAVVPFIALHIRGFSNTSQVKLILFGIIGGAAAYYIGNRYVGGAYIEWKTANTLYTAPIITDTNFNWRETAYTHIPHFIITAVLGTWLASRRISNDNDNGKEFRILSRYILSFAITGLAITGNLYGAMVAGMFYIMLADSPKKALRRTYVPLTLIVTYAIYVAATTMATEGALEGLKTLTSFPYPNWYTLAHISLTATIIFIIGSTYYLLSPNNNRANIYIFIALAMFAVVLPGVFMKWAAARYLIQCHPFLLIVCALVIYNSICHYITPSRQKSRFCLYIITAIGASGVIDGHGLLSAYAASTINYGNKLNETAMIFPVYPDHKNPGLFLKASIKPGDIVIAEDALQQRWYTGHVDYWLHKYDNKSSNRENHTSHPFSYTNVNGELRDIYVNSRIATTDHLTSLDPPQGKRLWVITSAETILDRPHYITQKQQEWIEDIETKYSPVYVGQDGITKVFCINCTESTSHNSLQSRQ